MHDSCARRAEARPNRGSGRSVGRTSIEKATAHRVRAQGPCRLVRPVMRSGDGAISGRSVRWFDEFSDHRRSDQVGARVRRTSLQSVVRR